MSAPHPPPVCIFYTQGKCRKGNDCGFYHSEPDKPQRPQKERSKNADTAFGLPVEDVHHSLKLARLMHSDMKVWEQRDIWPFTSYMPLDKPKKKPQQKKPNAEVNSTAVETVQGPQGEKPIETASSLPTKTAENGQISQVPKIGETAQGSQTLKVAETANSQALKTIEIETAKDQLEQKTNEINKIVELPPYGTIPRMLCFSDVSPEEIRSELVKSDGDPYSPFLVGLVNRYDCIRRTRSWFAKNQGACQNEIIASLKLIHKMPAVPHYTAVGLETGTVEFTHGDPYPDRLRRMMSDLAVFDSWFGHMQAYLEIKLNPVHRPTSVPRAVQANRSTVAENRENVEPSGDRANLSLEQPVTSGRRTLGVHTASNIPSVPRTPERKGSGSGPGTNQFGFNNKCSSNQSARNGKSGIPVPCNQQRASTSSLSKLPVATAHDSRPRPPTNNTSFQPRTAPRDGNSAISIPKATAHFRQTKPNQPTRVRVVPLNPERDYLRSDIEMEDLTDWSRTVIMLPSEETEADAPVAVATCEAPVGAVEVSDPERVDTEVAEIIESFDAVAPSIEHAEAIETLRSEVENVVEEAENSMVSLDRDASRFLFIEGHELDTDTNRVPIEMPQTPTEFLAVELDASFEAVGSPLNTTQPFEMLRSGVEYIVEEAESSIEILDRDVSSSTVLDWNQDLEPCKERGFAPTPTKPLKRKAPCRKCNIV